MRRNNQGHECRRPSRKHRKAQKKATATHVSRSNYSSVRFYRYPWCGPDVTPHQPWQRQGGKFWGIFGSGAGLLARVIPLFDACYVRGSTFRLKWFLNDLRHSLTPNRRKLAKKKLLHYPPCVPIDHLGFFIRPAVLLYL